MTDTEWRAESVPWDNAAGIIWCVAEYKPGARAASRYIVNNTDEPTAKLVAAAPDMLAALEEAVVNCARCGGFGQRENHTGQPTEQPCSGCVEWRAALKKAKP